MVIIIIIRLLITERMKTKADAENYRLEKKLWLEKETGKVNMQKSVYFIEG